MYGDMQMYGTKPKGPIQVISFRLSGSGPESLNPQVNTGNTWNISQFGRDSIPSNCHTPCSGVRYLKSELRLLVLITHSEKERPRIL